MRGLYGVICEGSSTVVLKGTKQGEDLNFVLSIDAHSSNGTSYVDDISFTIPDNTNKYELGLVFREAFENTIVNLNSRRKETGFKFNLGISHGLVDGIMEISLLSFRTMSINDIRVSSSDDIALSVLSVSECLDEHLFRLTKSVYDGDNEAYLVKHIETEKLSFDDVIGLAIAELEQFDDDVAGFAKVALAKY